MYSFTDRTLRCAFACSKVGGNEEIDPDIALNVVLALNYGMNMLTFFESSSRE